MKKIKLKETKFSPYLNAGNIEVSEELLSAFERFAAKIGTAKAVQVAQYAIDKKWLQSEPVDYETGAQGLQDLIQNDDSMKRQLGNVGVAVGVLGDEFAELLEVSGLGNYPDVVAELAAVGGQMAIDAEQAELQQEKAQARELEAKKAQLEAEKTAPQVRARAEIDSIRNDKSNPFHERYLKGEKAATEHVQRLYEQVNPSRVVTEIGPRHADKPRDESASSASFPLGALSSTDYARGDD